MFFSEEKLISITETKKKTNHMALSGMAVQHADDGYS